MNKFLAFSVLMLLIGATDAQAADLGITASCPSFFSNSSDGQAKLKLEEAEVWFAYFGLQEPTDSPKGLFSDWQIDQAGAWQLRCRYQASREIIIELPDGTHACQTGRKSKAEPYQASCTGTAAVAKMPPDTVHIIAPWTEAVALKGFRLGQSIEQVRELAISLGATLRVTDRPEDRVADISIGPDETIHVAFDSTGHVREVEWRPSGDALRIAVLSFGFFDDIKVQEQVVVWKRVPGVLLKAHGSSTEAPSNFIRLQRK